MRQISLDMASEYERIVARAAEDPGTAGDQGEESWAELLRNWLPATYHVVTKGRLLFEDDTASPQIDILILSPDYPLHLRNRKLYLAGGVIAAFECKLTLKSNHFKKFFETSELIKSKTPIGNSTTYESFNSKIIYGLLAHSHSWTKNIPIADQVFNIMEKMPTSKEGLEFDKANFYPDVICISDTVTYCYRKNLSFIEDADEVELKMLQEMKSNSMLSLSYDAYWSDSKDSWVYGIVHGALITNLFHRMAYSNISLRDMASYIMKTDIASICIGKNSIYSITLDDFVIKNYFDNGGSDNPWNHWGKDL